MEEQRPVGGTERQVPKLVEDDEIGVSEPRGICPGFPWAFINRTVRGSGPVPGRPDSHSDGPFGRLAPRGSRCGLTRTQIDQPCLSPDLSSARERLAVGLCLADACDPRRA